MAINFKSKKFRFFILLIIIAAVIGGVIYFNKNDEAEVIYREDKVEIGSIQIQVLATGTVQPENRLEIKPPIPGRVEEVLVKEGDVVKRGQILAWMSSTERAAILDSARTKGAAEIKRWEGIYPPTPIIAPLSGTIVLRNVEQGQTFTSSDSLISMSNRLTVKAQVDETDIASIYPKQEAEIILDAYSRDKIPAVVDKIAFDATTVNSVTTYIVDVLPSEVPSFMRSGMTANVTFFINSKENILLVPSEAIKIKNGRPVVLIPEGKKQIEKEIEIGMTNGKKTEVTSGLNEGDIVLSVQVKLSDDKNGSSPLSPMRNRPRR